MNLNCVIVDDENGAIEVLSRYINQTPVLTLTHTFRDSIEALDFLMKNEVDILFLDIDMPNLNGMQLSDLIRNRCTRVIFCTAYSEYAVESYERNAVDYLMKPISYDRFLKAIGKIIVENKKRTEFGAVDGDAPAKSLFIKSGSKIHQLDSRDLLYMKKDGHYIVFYTASGEVLSRMNMQELMRVLPSRNFVRIHRSYVIAIDKIDTIEKYDVMINGKEIPIGNSYRQNLLNAIEYAGK